MIAKEAASYFMCLAGYKIGNFFWEGGGGEISFAHEYANTQVDAYVYP